MPHRRAKIPVTLGFLVLWLPSLPAPAQTTGSIEGTIRDAGDTPLSGVTVEIRSPALQGTRIVVAGTAGSFRFPAIPPGIYTVTATLTGFRKVERSGVRVNLDATATVPIRMEIALSQEVVVRSEAPAIDTADAAHGLNIRQDVVQKLPLASRNYASVVEIYPGVLQDTVDTQDRYMSFSIYGATSLENQYLVDGVNTTNVIQGFQGKALTQEFVEEVQIKAGAYEAEYGRAMGGIINVVTKSGGNDFHGDAFGYVNSKGLTASPKANAATDENYLDTSRRDIQDFGADLGGFALKDRLWFFGAYDRVNTSQDRVLLAGTGLPNAGMNFPISFHTDLYSGKLTARPTTSTTLVGTIFGDPEVRTGALRNFSSSNPLSQDGIRKIGATDYAVSLTQLFGSAVLLEARYSRHKDRFTDTGVGSMVPAVYDYTQDLFNPTASGGFGGVFGFADDNLSKRDAVKASLNVFLGRHEIKGGVDFENNVTDSTDYFSGGALLSIYPCVSPGSSPPSSICTGGHAGDAVYYGHSFYTLTTDKTKLESAFLPGGNTVSPRTYRLGLFLQDSWKVVSNLTVHAGLRYDQEDIRNYDGSQIYNQTVVDASGKVLQQGGQPFFLKNEWQPRLGIAWDPARDGSTKVSASWGRFYYALPTDITVRSYSRKINATTWNYSSDPLNLAQDPTIGRAASVQGGVNSEPFQDNLKGIYQDEYAFGFEKAFNSSLSVGVRYMYRNLGRIIEDRCDLDANYPEANGNTCVIINPGSSSPLATGQGIHTCDGRDYLPPPDPSVSACTGPQTTNQAVPAVERKFHGVEFVVKNRISSQMWAQFSYLWSHLYGNYDGEATIGELANPGGAQTDPGINADFDYPLLSKYAYGNLTLDRRHSFRLDGTYTFPFGLTLGLGTFLRSGAPVSQYGYFNSGYEYLVQPRGTAGQLPWDYEVNLSASWAIRLAGKTVTLMAQGNNLLNRQAVIGREQHCSIAPPTNNDPNLVGVCTAAGGNPDGANPYYNYVTWRGSPRVIKFGARLTF